MLALSMVLVTDASGRYSSQFFFGNDFWLGSHTLCQELQNPRTNKVIPPFKVNFHVAILRLRLPHELTPRLGSVSLANSNRSSIVPMIMDRNELLNHYSEPEAVIYNITTPVEFKPFRSISGFPYPNFLDIRRSLCNNVATCRVTAKPRRASGEILRKSVMETFKRTLCIVSKSQTHRLQKSSVAAMSSVNIGILKGHFNRSTKALVRQMRIVEFALYRKAIHCGQHLPVLTGHMGRQISLGVCLPKACRGEDISALLQPEVPATEAALLPHTLQVLRVRPIPGEYRLLRDTKLHIMALFCQYLVSYLKLLEYVIYLFGEMLEVMLRDDDPLFYYGGFQLGHVTRSWL
ncbi:hypothetical protein J6590_017299 [Homalodisca vitripennis]|nr:hypothetical protein J6590_017299 [Homalodisca vitripennis]